MKGVDRHRYPTPEASVPESLAGNFEALVPGRWLSGVSLCSPFSNFRFDVPETARYMTETGSQSRISGAAT